MFYPGGFCFKYCLPTGEESQNLLRGVCKVARSLGCERPMAERRTIFEDSNKEIN